MTTEILDKVATLEDVRNEVSWIKSMVSDAVDDGVRAAIKAIEAGREAAEDALYDAQRAAKQKPLQALGLAFAAGAVIGGLILWMGRRG